MAYERLTDRDGGLLRLKKEFPSRSDIIETLAKMYGRDLDDLTKHIEKIRSDGTIDKILKWKRSVSPY